MSFITHFIAEEKHCSLQLFFLFLFGYGILMAPPSRISAADSWYVVYLVDIGAVWLVDIVVFCRIVVCTACMSLTFFSILSPRLPVSRTICLHFDISVSRRGMGGI